MEKNRWKRQTHHAAGGIPTKSCYSCMPKFAITILQKRDENVNVCTGETV